MFINKKEWDKKLKVYVVENLVDLVNELRKNLKGMFKFIKIWKWCFIGKIEFISLVINFNGEFVVIFDDKKLFVGYKIVVNGNINGEFLNFVIVENFNIEDYKKVEFVLFVSEEKNENILDGIFVVDNNMNDKEESKE